MCYRCRAFETVQRTQQDADARYEKNGIKMYPHARKWWATEEPVEEPTDAS